MHAALARGGGALVADHAAREAGQDRREGGPAGRYVTFELAEVAIPRSLFANILRLVDDLRPAPLPP